MFNKKRIVVFGVFVLFMFAFITFAGGTPQNQAIATRNVTFIDSYNNEELSSQRVIVGEDATVPNDPNHDGYIFVGWYLSEDPNVRVENFTNIINNLSVTAKYGADANRNGILDDNEARYTVTFIDAISGSVLKVEEVLPGLAATAPIVPTYPNMTFTGWSTSYTNVGSDITVNTVYTTTITSTVTNPTTPVVEETYFNVTFIDSITNEVIEVVSVREGLTASTPREELIPAHDQKLFTGWSGNYSNVTSDEEVYTVYIDDLNRNGKDDVLEEHYSITFNAGENGKIAVTDTDLRDSYTINNILTGTTFGSNVTELPKVKANAYYVANGWVEEIPASDYVITSSLTFNASYLDDKNNNGIADNSDEEKYVHVTFIDTLANEDNKVLKEEDVLTGMDATAPDPRKYDQKLFIGWIGKYTKLNYEDASSVEITTNYADDKNNNGKDDKEEVGTEKTLSFEYVSINPTASEKEGKTIYNKLTPETELASKTLLPDEPFTVTAPNITNYKVVSVIGMDNVTFDSNTGELSGKMIKTNATIKFIYEPVGEDKNNNGKDDRDEVGTEKTLSYRYVSYNKLLSTKDNPVYNELTPDEIVAPQTKLPGEPYSVNAPTITNYTVIELDKVKSGTMPNDNLELTFTYKPITDENEDGITDEIQKKSTLTIKYVSYAINDNGELVTHEFEDKKIVKNEVVVDYLYTVSTLKIDGYKYDEDKTKELNNVESLSFRMPANDYTFTVYYKVNGSDDNKNAINDSSETQYTLKLRYVGYYIDENGVLHEGENLGGETVDTDFVANEKYDVTDLVLAKTNELNKKAEKYSQDRSDKSLTGTIDSNWAVIIDDVNVITLTVYYKPLTDENNNGILDDNEPDKYTLIINYVSVYTDENGNTQERLMDTDTATKRYVVKAPYNVSALVSEKVESLKSNYKVIDRTKEKGKIKATEDKINTVTIKFEPLKDDNHNGIDDNDGEQHFDLRVSYVIVKQDGVTVADTELLNKHNTTKSYVVGAPYTIKTPKDDIFDKYTLVNTEDASGVMTSGGVDVTLKYKVKEVDDDLNDNGILDSTEKKYPLTLKYISYGENDSVEVLPSITIDYVDGANYTIKEPQVPRKIKCENSEEICYEITSEYPIKGTMDAKATNVIIVKYKALKDENGNGKNDLYESTLPLTIKFIRKEYKNDEVTTIELKNPVTKHYLDGQNYEIEVPSSFKNGKYELKLENNSNVIVKEDKYYLTGTKNNESKETVEVIYTPKTDTNGDGIDDSFQKQITYIVDGVIKFQELITIGEDTPIIKDPEKAESIFAGWTPAVSKKVENEATYTATWKSDKNNNKIDDETEAKFTVKFLGKDNEELKSESVLIGTSATAPENAPTTIGEYKFVEWDTPFDNVQSDLTVKAVYKDAVAPVITNESFALYKNDEKTEISATVTDAGSGVSEVRYTKGKVSKETAKTGTEMTLKNGKYVAEDITSNGYYTIYAKDVDGNDRISDVLLVEGIIVLDGNIEDMFTTVKIGEVKGTLSEGYSKDLTIETKSNVEIAEVKIHSGRPNAWPFYGEGYITEAQFSNDRHVKDISDQITNNKAFSYTIEDSALDCITIYVKYKYYEEIAPGVFASEPKYATKIYKTFLSKYFDY